MSYENPWLYNGIVVDAEVLSNYTGFVYMITNLTNEKKYIGKKLAKFSRTTTKTVTLKNGTKKKKKIRNKIDSDWQEYYGSNKELQQDVLTLGPQSFRREILRLCKSKGECNYHEAKLQFAYGVLENDYYYNSWISVKVSRSHMK